jgi:hypothetical protein
MEGLEAVCGQSIIPPEMDNYAEELDQREDLSNFRYACLDIRNLLGEEEFKELYMVQIPYVKRESPYLQRRFLIEMQEKISEIYDWEFPDEWALVDTIYQQEQLYEFIEFLEFENYRFLSYVWRFLLDESIKLMKLNIENFCKTNTMKIIKETEEQLETHSQNRLITIFLRTYYKEKYIEWFTTMSQRYKVEIISENYEY